MNEFVLSMFPPNIFFDKITNKHEKEPQTPDDFLEQGVSFEEAGEKWRAGDPVKAMRFFQRAIETYDVGLGRFGGSFDLAYNKYDFLFFLLSDILDCCDWNNVLISNSRARVQYQTTLHPKLAKQLPAPQIELLRVALESHRFAMSLPEGQQNADTLFNTAQVLTSLAEVGTEGKGRKGGVEVEVIREGVALLEEALGLFNRCAEVQEGRFREELEMRSGIRDDAGEEQGYGQATAAAAMETDMTSSSSATPQTATSGEEWAIVEQPVTKSTLLDTALAQLQTLTTMCGLLTTDTSGAGIQFVTENAESVDKRLPEFMPSIEDPEIEDEDELRERVLEVNLTKAGLRAAMADLMFRAGRIEVPSYKEILDDAFGFVSATSSDPDPLCAKADALTAFNTALADTLPTQDSSTLTTRWTALSSALTDLTTASKAKVIGNTDPAKIHIARGDAEMGRYRLGYPRAENEVVYAPASQNRLLLLKNARTYYRGAAATAMASAGFAVPDQDVIREARGKECVCAVVMGERADGEKLAGMVGEDGIFGVVSEMLDDGLLGIEDLETLKAAGMESVVARLGL